MKSNANKENKDDRKTVQSGYIIKQTSNIYKGRVLRKVLKDVEKLVVLISIGRSLTLSHQPIGSVLTVQKMFDTHGLK